MVDIQSETAETIGEERKEEEEQTTG